MVARKFYAVAKGHRTVDLLAMFCMMAAKRRDFLTHRTVMTSASFHVLYSILKIMALIHISIQVAIIEITLTRVHQQLDEAFEFGEHLLMKINQTINIYMTIMLQGEVWTLWSK